MLAASALDQKKVCPLYTTRNGKPTVRIRALQHMSICDIRREIAVEVAAICKTNDADEEQMRRVRNLMKEYGKQCSANPSAPPDIQQCRPFETYATCWKTPVRTKE